MTPPRAICVCIVLSFLVACAADPAVPAGSHLAPVLAGEPADGRYIVVLDGSASPSALANSAGAAPLHTYGAALDGFSARLSPQAIDHLRANPHVLFIEPDSEVHAVAQTLPMGVNRIEADLNDVADIDGVDVRVDVGVAILDTGVDLDHPDLNVVAGVHLTRGRDKGGDDGNGHGSHVAGIVGALDNGIGSVGVAPGARIYAVKVLGDSGSGFVSEIIAGIDWVTARADVISVANMSLGGGGVDDTNGGDCHASQSSYHLALCGSVDAGIVYTVAAGNEADDAANHVPAAYDEALTVSALADFDGVPGGLLDTTVVFSACTETLDDSFACFSNYGSDVDAMAPGVRIYSTWMAGGYNTISGTSMASPHAAGAVALEIAANGRDRDIDGDFDAADVAAIRSAVVAAGNPAPCDGGVCADDPDDAQEPLLDVGGGCSVAADCDDQNTCTDDACAGGTCTHAAVADDAACAGGLCCGGVCAPSACVGDADCSDGSDCTTDACLGGGTCAAMCTHSALVDGSSCATGSCCAGVCCGDLCCAGACVAPACDLDADCGDAQACTTDTCSDPTTCTAACTNSWAACGAADSCCGPACDAGNDGDCGGAVCGNLVCEGAGEDCHTCPGDCRCSGRDCAACCGDGACTASEKPANCPVDCG